MKIACGSTKFGKLGNLFHQNHIKNFIKDNKNHRGTEYSHDIFRVGADFETFCPIL